MAPRDRDAILQAHQLCHDRSPLVITVCPVAFLQNFFFSAYHVRRADHPALALPRFSAAMPSCTLAPRRTKALGGGSLTSVEPLSDQPDPESLLAIRSGRSRRSHEVAEFLAVLKNIFNSDCFSPLGSPSQWEIAFYVKNRRSRRSQDARRA